jgi:hypothetical protein
MSVNNKAGRNNYKRKSKESKRAREKAFKEYIGIIYNEIMEFQK